MKKFLPLILVFVGVVVLVGVFVLVKGKKGQDSSTDDETALMNVPLERRPVVSLIPTSDGHYLKLRIEKLLKEAATLDYDLLYQNAEGVTQGVPGKVDLKGQKTVEEELLLGSESSGKFRYDEGVENGSLSLKFRNGKGKLLAKFELEFKMLSDTESLVSSDGKFVIQLTEGSGMGFFVLMETLGMPESPQKEVKAGPYGFFSSKSDKFSGRVSIDQYKVYMHVTGPRWNFIDGEEKLDSESGVFIGASE